MTQADGMWGSEFRIQNSEFRIQNSEFGIQNPESRIQNSEFRIQNSEVHDQGAAWDVVTLNVFKNWQHFAAQETVPKDVNDAVARKAGFGSAEAIGPYMRTLISTHRDTLGPIIPVETR